MSVAPRLAGKCLSMLRLAAAGFRRLASRGDTLAAAWRGGRDMACSLRFTVDPWGWGGEGGAAASSGGREEGMVWGGGGEPTPDPDAAAPAITFQPSSCTLASTGEADPGNERPLLLPLAMELPEHVDLAAADVTVAPELPLLLLHCASMAAFFTPLAPSLPAVVGDDPVLAAVALTFPATPTTPPAAWVGFFSTSGSGDLREWRRRKGSSAWVASWSCSVSVDSSSSWTNMFLSTRSQSLLLEFPPLRFSSATLQSQRKYHSNWRTHHSLQGATLGPCMQRLLIYHKTSKCVTIIHMFQTQWPAWRPVPWWPIFRLPIQSQPIL